MLVNKNKIKFSKDQLRLTESAILNWARWTEEFDFNQKTLFQEATNHLLAILDEVKYIYPKTAYPDWMTQEKPGVDYWLYLPNSKVVLLLVKSKDGSPYLYMATSALASKRQRKLGKSDLELLRPNWTENEISRLEKLSSADLFSQVRISNHACERILERLPEFANQLGINKLTKESLEVVRDHLRLLVSQTGVFKRNAGYWANGTNKKDTLPVLLLTWEAQEIALLLSIDQSPDSQEDYCATTAIPKRWSVETLFELRGSQLLKAIYISNNFSDQKYQEIVDAIVAAEEIEVSNQPMIESEQLKIYLRPTSSLQKSQTSKLWAIDYIEEIS